MDKKNENLSYQIEQAIQEELERARKLYPKHESIEESIVVLKRKVRKLEYACDEYAIWRKIARQIKAGTYKDANEEPYAIAGIDEIISENEAVIREEAIKVAAMARRAIQDMTTEQHYKLLYHYYKHNRIDFYMGRIENRIIRLCIWMRNSGDTHSKICQDIENLITEMLLNTGIWEVMSELR